MFFPNSRLLHFSAGGLSNFSRASGWYYLAPAMSPPASTEAAGSKNARAVILPATAVVGRRKNAHIYIIKRAKKMCSRKCNSRELVFGKEHTAWHRKFNNLKCFKQYDKDLKKPSKSREPVPSNRVSTKVLFLLSTKSKFRQNFSIISSEFR
jgi:hypothetical protein